MPLVAFFRFLRIVGKSTGLVVLAVTLWTSPVGATRYVSVTGADVGNDCTDSASPCETVQWAVDLATPGEEIRVAEGTYSGATVRVVNRVGTDYEYKQVVFVNKPLTLRGGYTESDWTTPNPSVHVTSIDAQGNGRPLSIVDTLENLVVIDGFTLTGGDYTGLGNPTGLVNHVCRGQGDEDCGGGLYVYQSAFQLVNSVVNGNVASTVAGDGGGMYLWQARQSTIEESRIVGNSAAYSGGGVYVTEQSFPLTMSHLMVSGNSAFRGGGIDLGSSIYGSNVLEDSILIGNTAVSGDAGGLYARLTDDGVVLTVQRVVVRDNEAYGQGKGMFIDAAGLVSPEVRLVNVVFSGNGPVSGAPITQRDAVLAVKSDFTSLAATLAHVTAADNPTTNFLYVRPDFDAGTLQVTAANVLLAGFENGYAAEEIGTGEATVEHSNTLFYDVLNHHRTVAGTPTFIEIDPVMGDPRLDGLQRVRSGSAAIDAALDLGLSEDFEREPRPEGVAPDIGADEFWGLFSDGFESGDTSVWSP